MSSTPLRFPAASSEPTSWPSIGDSEADAIRSLLFQFDETQWWPAGSLRQAQLAQATAVLRYARGARPGWRDALAALDFTRGDPLDDGAWRSVPVLRRPALQAAGPALHCAPPASHGPVGESYTSGSTGMPVRTLGTRVTRLIWNALTVREHLWHRRDLSRTLGAIRVLPAAAQKKEPLRATTWGAPLRLLYRTGPSEGLTSSPRSKARSNGCCACGRPTC